MIFFSFSALIAFVRIFYASALSGVRVFQITEIFNAPIKYKTQYTVMSIKPVFNFNRIIGNFPYSIVFISLVLHECSRNNEIQKYQGLATIRLNWRTAFTLCSSKASKKFYSFKTLPQCSYLSNRNAVVYMPGTSQLLSNRFRNLL